MTTINQADTLSITATRPTHWNYVSEGGATIVFSYSGPPNAHFDGTVLRLRKALRSSSAASAQNAEIETERDPPSLDFHSLCIGRLIPSEHLPRLESVYLDRDWLQELHNLQESHRPLLRRQKDSIDLNNTIGVLATDLVGGNWLAVEIKPKWGFISRPTHLSEETRAIKTQTCRFCMHSYMKAQEGETVCRGYCPLDLFSGDERRINLAINALWTSWRDSNGTINNLKIFARGGRIDPTEVHSMLACNSGHIYSEADIRDVFTSLLLRALLETPVLGILSHLQRTFDALDIEGLSTLLQRTQSLSTNDVNNSNLLPSRSPFSVNSPFLSSPDMADWTRFLGAYLAPSSAEMDKDNPSPEEARHYILAYLLSATFKDCSIIVRLPLLHSESATPHVTVIDLDSKPIEKLADWETLDRKIATTYARVAERKLCIDAGSCSK